MGEINRAAVADILIPKFAGFFYDNIRGHLPLLKAGFVDHSDELREQGESVKIAIPGEFNLNKQSVDANVNIQDASLSSDFLTLDNYFPLDFAVRDVAQTLTNEDLLKTFADSAAMSYAKAVEKDFSNVFDSAYFACVGTVAVTNGSKAVAGTGTKFTTLRPGMTIKTAGAVVRIIEAITSDTAMTVTSNFLADETGVAYTASNTVYYASNAKIGDASIREARTILSNNGVEEGSRVLVCNPDDYNDLLDDTHYKDKDSINAQVLREAALGRIRSFDTYESNNFQKTYSVGFNPTAVGVAFRAFKAVPGSMADSKVIVDPVSKIPLRITLTWDRATRSVVVAIDLLYGIKLFRPKQVVKIYQAA